MLIDWLNVTIWLKRCTLLEKKSFKIYLNLNEKINSSLMWTEHTEYEYKKLQLPTWSVISTITHSAKYRLIIVIEKIPNNIEISFFPISHTPRRDRQDNAEEFQNQMQKRLF